MQIRPDSNLEAELLQAYLRDSSNLPEIGNHWQSYSVKASSAGDETGTQTAFSMTLISSLGIERYKYTIRIPIEVTEIPLMNLFSVDWMTANFALWDDAGVIDECIAVNGSISPKNIARIRFSDVAGTNYLGRGVVSSAAVGIFPATGTVSGIAASTSSAVMANGLTIGVGA